jgi:hypothetical protein
MIKFLFFFCFYLLQLPVFAQTERFYYPDAFYFVKEVSTIGQAGKTYRFSIAVKENGADEKSKPRIYAIQVRKGKEDVIGKTLSYASASGSDWKTYSVEGIMDSAATKLWLYVAVNGNGDFYFDNLQFAIKNTNTDWEKQPLSNYSFEDGGKKLLKSYYSKRSAPELKIAQATDAAEGKSSLHVFASGMKASTAFSTDTIKQ